MENSKRDWKDIAKDAVETILKYANTSAQDIIEEKKKKFGKKAVAIVLLLIGFVFLLIGLSEFINQLMENGTWQGYTIVGSLLVLFGLFLTRD